MNATPFPLEPAETAAPRLPSSPTSSHKLEAVRQVVDDLRRCRAALDMLDLPLAAAHVDMAVHTLKPDCSFDDAQAPFSRDELPAFGARNHLG